MDCQKGNIGWGGWGGLEAAAGGRKKFFVGIPFLDFL
jgi:hypothetical protein